MQHTVLTLLAATVKQTELAKQVESDSVHLNSLDSDAGIASSGAIMAAS